MRGSITILLLLAVIACREVDTSRQLPVLRTDDPRLSLHQDTLLLDGQPFTGSLIAFLPNGDTALFESRVQGVEDGPSLRWHDNGQPMEARFYEQGRKKGIHRGYWPNGKPRFEYHFKEGEHDGPMNEWYEDGTPLRAFHMRMGYEDGQQRLWWANGSLRANYTVHNGRRYGLLGLKLCANPVDSIR
jgi:antitoxin component YwqK of YwqJK toxin-antitoxin module